MNVSNDSNKRRFSRKHDRAMQQLFESKRILQNVRLQMIKNITVLKRKDRTFNVND